MFVGHATRHCVNFDSTLHGTCSCQHFPLFQFCILCRMKTCTRCTLEDRHIYVLKLPLQTRQIEFKTSISMSSVCVELCQSNCESGHVQALESCGDILMKYTRHVQHYRGYSQTLIDKSTE